MEAIKEEIAFLRQIWGALLTIISALIAWLAITTDQSVAVGLAFVTLFTTSVVFTVVQIKIYNLINRLKDASHEC